jgi:hypothetical protein
MMTNTLVKVKIGDSYKEMTGRKTEYGEARNKGGGGGGE